MRSSTLEAPPALAKAQRDSPRVERSLTENTSGSDRIKTATTLEAAGGPLSLNRELAQLLHSKPEVARGIGKQIQSANALQTLSARQCDEIGAQRENIATAEANTPRVWKGLQAIIGDQLPITPGARLRSQMTQSIRELHNTMVLQNAALRDIDRRVEHFLRRHDPVTRELSPWSITLKKHQGAGTPPPSESTVLESIEGMLQQRGHLAVENFVGEVKAVGQKPAGAVGEKIGHLVKFLETALAERARAAIEICGELGLQNN